MSRPRKVGLGGFTVSLTLEAAYVAPLLEAQKVMGLASPGRTAKAILQAALGEETLLKSVDREARLQAAHEYRVFVVQRLALMLDELKQEMVESLNRTIEAQTLGGGT